MKRRKKEFGLMSVLGMERRHIAQIIILETLYVFVLSLILGLIVGLVFSKLAHLILLSLLQFDFKFGFSVSWEAMRSAVILFAGIFLLLLLSSLRQVRRARPIELIRGGQTGEKEPKARWLIALLGLISLGGGYWISVTTEEPIEVIMLFFAAAALVIIGTYLLFVAGGVTFLKLLRKNKGYYYKTNHFISVSGMMYRMKQNAAGLATICILATMVLVMISSTAALYFGMEDSLNRRYIRGVIFNVHDVRGQDIELINDTARKTLADINAAPKDWMAYRIVPLFGRRQDNEVIVDGMYRYDWDMINIYLIPLEDYNKFAEKPAVLEDGQVLLLSTVKPYGAETITLPGHTFRVLEEYETFTPFSMSRSYNTDPSPIYTIVVKDMETIESLHEACGLESGMRYQFGFDLEIDGQEQIETGWTIASKLGGMGIDNSVVIRAAQRASFLELYGGLFFLGLFLGFVFILATVLIIYYKQISEGYDDQRRYSIMKKVGLSRREIKRSINSQILTMFFLPLIMACVHIAFAFPAVTRMLYVLDLDNVNAFLIATVLSIIVFALFYMAVYKLTARVYYRLVESGNK